MGFQSYIEPVKASYEDHKLTSKERDRKQNSRLDKLGISEDQLLLEQEALFEKARLKYLAAQNPVGESSENQP